ncbi:hypothetical protein [Nonomuraea sp. B19D2]|uniref:hypothetical protein n=1 Tax=Nonomuraea sp. B19D2 TaxID=3159561 RepID=UPI0032DA9967
MAKAKAGGIILWRWTPPDKIAQGYYERERFTQFSRLAGDTCIPDGTAGTGTHREGRYEKIDDYWKQVSWPWGEYKYFYRAGLPSDLFVDGDGIIWQP